MTETDRAILEFEKQWWQLAGNKETAIRSTFGLSAVRYYQKLNRLLDAPDALQYDPQLVRRLQRIRESRMTARSRGCDVQ